jgi:hypothetical protein
MIYGMRIHDRMTEDDPDLATVMYADDERSTWWDMATGHPHHIEEILGALEWREDMRQAERDREIAYIRAEMEAHRLDRSEFTVCSEDVGNPAQQNGMCVDDPEEARREL